MLADSFPSQSLVIVARIIITIPYCPKVVVPIFSVPYTAECCIPGDPLVRSGYPFKGILQQINITVCCISFNIIFNQRCNPENVIGYTCIGSRGFFYYFVYFRLYMFELIVIIIFNSVDRISKIRFECKVGGLPYSLSGCCLKRNHRCHTTLLPKE